MHGPNADLFDHVFPHRRVARLPKTSEKVQTDTISSLRPKNNLDYKISQTYTKFDVGDKKVSVRFTEAKYEKPVDVGQEENVIRYCSIAPPCLVWIDDLRKQAFDARQQQLNINQKRKDRENKIQQRKLGITMHKKLQDLVGPKWFQELSPHQMNLIDNLKQCIDQDLYCGTIVFCQDLIAKLGLVLRPNHKHIEKALNRCCGIPEEFLLLLYQFINPNRTEYSINDRLLLSSVVHLSITKTLRELHVRIPSPPPPIAKKKSVKKSVVKEKPKSPYLERLIVKRRKPKTCNELRIYYPKSPYFVYIPKMREDMSRPFGMNENTSNDEIEAMLINETNKAQEYYNELTENFVGRTLLKPTVIKECIPEVDNLIKETYYKETVSEEDNQGPTNENSTGEDHISKITQNSEGFIKGEDDCLLKLPTMPIIYTTLEKIEKLWSTSTTATGKSPIGSMKKVTKTYSRRAVFGSELPSTSTYELIPKEEQDSLASELILDCLPVLEGNSKEASFEEAVEEPPESFCITGDPNEALPTLKGPEECTCYLPSQIASPVITGCKMTPSGHMIPIIQGIRENTCTCAQIYEHEIDRLENEKINILARLELKNQPNRYVISGVAMGPDGPIFILNGILPSTPLNGQPERTLKDWRNLISKYDVYDIEKKKPASTEKPKPKRQKICKCKEKSTFFMKTQCQCEKCKAIDRSKNPFFISGGSKETDEGLVTVVSGVCIRKCKCLQEYEEKIEKYELGKIIKSVKKKLKENRGFKYIIGGISNTPSGPVYNITGVKEKFKCRCREMYLQKLEEAFQRTSNYVEDDHFLKLNEPSKVKVKSTECRVCKQHYQKFVNILCNCPRCTEERNREQGTWILSGSKLTECGYIIPVIGGIRPHETCECLKDYEKRIEDYEKGLYTRDQMRKLRQQNLVIGGLVSGKENNEFVISGVYEGDFHSFFNDDPNAFLSYEDQEIMEVCKCRQELEKFFAKKCRCPKCNEARKRLSSINSNSLDKAEADVIEENVDNTTPFHGDWDLFNTNMRVASTMNWSGQDTDTNQDTAAKDNPTDKHSVCECDCFFKYVEKLKLYEEYKTRINASLQMQSSKDKYIVGGIVTTKDGPVYIISGVKQPSECKCAEYVRKELERNRLMALTPKALNGRMLYSIAGVKETEQGNVFILSGVKTVIDCPCLNMFTKFEAAHAFCTDFYDKYLSQMLSYVQEYLNDLERQQEIYREEKEMADINNKQEEYRNLLAECKRLAEINELFMKEEPIIKPLKFNIDPQKLYRSEPIKTSVSIEHFCETPIEVSVEDISPKLNKKKKGRRSIKSTEDVSKVKPTKLKKKHDASVLKTDENRTESKNVKKKTNELNIKKNSEKTERKNVSKHKIITKRNANINKAASMDEDKIKTYSQYASNVDVKRFIILKKFPKRRNVQYELLKQALETLKMDGFYIANLPDCHKLPHFKLWLQMRAKVSWNPKDIEKIRLLSIKLGRKHINKCFAKANMHVALSESQILKATWKKSKYYKYLLEKGHTEFYRTLKQSMINNSREFYPILFPYEFYSDSLRHTFFALTPAKEEEVFPFKIIQPYEFQNK